MNLIAKLKNSNTLYFFCSALFLFVLYLLTAPHNVQVLDTGELVLNSYRSRVIHPPGYPLYNRLFFLATHLIPFGTIFFRAAIFNSILASGVLLFFFQLAKRESYLLATILSLPFISSFLVWKYSILPDVFMLHSFFVAGISYFYLAPKELSKNEIRWLFVLFALSSTNHLTTIFLFPLLFHACWKRISIKEFLYYSALSIIAVISIYLTILLMDVGHLTSWGDIRSLGDLLNHFLRSDYGTFQLHAGARESYFFLIIGEFTKRFFKDYLIFLALILTTITHRPAILKRWLFYLAIIFSYIIIFFYFSNIYPANVGAEVLERFYLLPSIMLVFLALSSLVHQTFKYKKRLAFWLIAASVIVSIKNLYLYYPELNLSKNTIIEDWAINRLNSVPTSLQAPTSKKTILLEEADTGYASLMYVQGVLDIRPDVLLMNKFLMYYYWHSTKWLKLLPDFKFEAKQINITRYMDMGTDLVGRNLDKYIFNTEKPFAGEEKFKAIYLALGRQLEPGVGLVFDNSSFSRIKKRTPAPERSKFFNQYSSYYARYATFFSALGSAYMQQQDLINAYKFFEVASQEVPFSVLAKRNLCMIKEKMKQADTQQCLDELTLLQWQSFPDY
ncbi:MAG: hypothetical protein A2504_03375 [Bdellovibrionales bacterium RIFOXYD12_FULL_39_22]|nr:MAG: hypothetical protein A2385_15785 [Bdellovibrionales bacterium RIFOXYB1_FULL_39_21]OFZ41565.1 MAG: hypothetical protein A2485_02475 [Bdellovibrionales bacterium RIFOXYC12_FULL_39_17]OFZ45878.1 MAG: hypothetical protein A2404_12840 [Bdellovibrionales bacterium RIFOXYC1_FULL_39_130]OFZ71940.1 MAG: hypothetical protein A2451_04250 [Bdellovibrionales bacterium RIFOXYC2_FULL_39_8]OFZ74810.1 MAG: hypothetical protein A2560_10270 [Bdellovibrionales bacterium RIFOXYD1_FULL_39_84]OFZ92670.1 MAG: